MSLRDYNRKRHFDKTTEPAGAEAPAGGHSFVIQKHAASHLHYDFRLELDGVLKSWAVPKGPNLDPSVKRLAMHVEDHPVAYGGFEGIIPEGEYGGGTVMLWDRGTWEPIGDANEGYRTGKLKFELFGEKLHGRWMLVRTDSSRDKEGRQWLLFKERDKYAATGKKADIVDRATNSVASGRDLDQIAADEDRVWTSEGEKKKPARKPTAKAHRTTPARSKSAKKTALPKRIEVELATLVDAPPAGDDWLHEIKYDGYRMTCRIDKSDVKFLTRNHKDWTARLTSLAKEAAKLPVSTAILDGEVVALRADGTTDFQSLQNAFSEKRADDLVYWVFDLLHLDGVDLSAEPLEERKALLAKLLEAKGLAAIRYSEHVEGNGADFFKQGCKWNLEGIISKRRDAPYRPGRGADWLKSKCMHKDEFVIGGFTDPERSREGFGALLLGYHEGKKLVYAGRVGTGFSAAALRDLTAKLTALQRDSSPFADLSRSARTQWVEPSLIAQVVFGSWTDEGKLRHASFQGLREDKAADEVTRDKAKKVAAVARRRKPKLAASASRLVGKQNDAAKNDDYDTSGQEFHGVRFTSPDKVLYPEQGITKLDLARYYSEVAEWMLPHVADRPLALVRCPEGRAKECFFQKHPAVGTPKELAQLPIKEKSKTEMYVYVEDAAGLLALAQIGALEVHAWGSRIDKVELPDRLVFDLDPDPTVKWPVVIAAARQIRRFLEDLGLESFVKTTGGKGLHLVVPIERRHDWDAAKAFCKQVADAIATGDPDRYTANMSKRARVGKIYIDYLRNGRGATAIVPYSTRARPGAPVSTPLTWDELSEKIPSDFFSVTNLRERLHSLKRDPWAGIAKVRQSLTRPLARLRTLT